MAKFKIDLNLPDVKIINIETTKAKDLAAAPGEIIFL